jgi:hypothetical protein
MQNLCSTSIMLKLTDITVSDLTEFLLDSNFNPVLATVDFRGNKGSMSRYKGDGILILVNPMSTVYMIFEKNLWTAGLSSYSYRYKPEIKPRISVTFR